MTSYINDIKFYLWYAVTVLCSIYTPATSPPMLIQYVLCLFQSTFPRRTCNQRLPWYRSSSEWCQVNDVRWTLGGSGPTTTGQQTGPNLLTDYGSHTSKSTSRPPEIIHMMKDHCSTLIIYLLSCHTFTPIEKCAFFFFCNFFPNCTLFVAWGTSEIARFPSGCSVHYPIRSSSTLGTSAHVLATPLLH